MDKIVFIGRVLPTPVKITIETPDLNWPLDDNNTLSIRVAISQSEVTTSCSTAHYHHAMFDDVFARCLDITKAVVNLFAFTTGKALLVVFDDVIYPHGVRAQIVPEQSNIVGLCQSYSLDRVDRFNEVLMFVGTDPHLFLALNDLIASISFHHQAPINCARVIDAIKHMIATPGGSDSEAWQQMRDTLHLSKDYVQFISNASKDIRHGRKVFVPGPVVAEIVRRTWIIMDRLFEYRRRGGSLPPSDFPFLTE